jgi:hypothetical protein
VAILASDPAISSCGAVQPRVSFDGSSRTCLKKKSEVAKKQEIPGQIQTDLIFKKNCWKFTKNGIYS